MKKIFTALLLSFVLCLGLISTASADYSDPDFGSQTGDSGSGDNTGDNTGGSGSGDHTGGSGSGDNTGGSGSGDNTGSTGNGDTTDRPNTDTNSGSNSDDASSSRRKGSGSSSSSGRSDQVEQSAETAPTTEATVTPETTETPATTEPGENGTTVVFHDVPEREWYYQAVHYVSDNGVMSGNGNSFAPNDRLTRGMMAQILYNMEKATDTGTASFPDVSASDWFANAAAWASSQGFMSGYSNTLFGSNDAITREQLAVILYRYAQAKGYDVTGSAELSGFADGASVASWSADAVRWAVSVGLLSGKSGSRLDPAGPATRAEVAQILMNFATKIAQ